MRSRKHLLRLASIAAIAVVTSSTPATAFAANPERPYRGSCSTVITPLPTPGALLIDYDCQLTHLGRTTAVATQVVTPTGGTGPIVNAQIENETVYTAANGDTLFVSFSGTAQINVLTGEVTFMGTETFDGGTGRFADATGSADLEGTASIFTNIGFFTTKGRLAY